MPKCRLAEHALTGGKEMILRALAVVTCLIPVTAFAAETTIRCDLQIVSTNSDGRDETTPYTRYYILDDEGDTLWIYHNDSGARSEPCAEYCEMDYGDQEINWIYIFEGSNYMAWTKSKLNRTTGEFSSLDITISSTLSTSMEAHGRCVSAPLPTTPERMF